MRLELPPDLAKKAFEEWGETPETRAQALEELRARLQKQPVDKQPHRLDDEWLIPFIRGCKFQLGKAEKKVLAMAAFMREHPEYTQGLHAAEFRELYGMGFMRILRGRDKQGRLISTLEPAKMAEIKDPTVFMRWNFWVTTVLMSDPYLQVNGQLVIESFENFSMMGMMRLQSIPSAIMRKNFKFAQECMPFKMGGIIVAHQPAYMSLLWALVRPFMSRKLRARVAFVGNNLEAFKEWADAEVLPPEFGGTLQEDPLAWLDEQAAAEKAAKGAAAEGTTHTLE